MPHLPKPVTFYRPRFWKAAGTNSTVDTPLKTASFRCYKTVASFALRFKRGCRRFQSGIFRSYSPLVGIHPATSSHSICHQDVDVTGSHTSKKLPFPIFAQMTQCLPGLSDGCQAARVPLRSLKGVHGCGHSCSSRFWPSNILNKQLVLQVLLGLFL